MSGNPLSADLDHVVEHLRPDLEELRGARIFVTGGTGFIGCWMLESFAWANDRLGLGAQALVLTRNFEAFQRKAPHLASRADICFHLGDVRDFEFPSGKFSHVIHSADAANQQGNLEDPALMLDTIVAGTVRTLDFSALCGARKMVLTSSGSVFRRHAVELTEAGEEYLGATQDRLAFWAHHGGKRLSELTCILHGQRDGIEMKIARCFTFVGPYMPLDAHFAIGNFIRDALAGGPIVVKGDGTPYRSYLYAADLAIWLWRILLRGKDRQAYNVGSPNALTIAEVAAAVSRALPGNVAVSIAQRPTPGQVPQRYVPDASRAETELGLREWIELEDAIRRTARWHQR
jgi:nucleoside-diphosphate-sugar epimerase